MLILFSLINFSLLCVTILKSLMQDPKNCLVTVDPHRSPLQHNLLYVYVDFNAKVDFPLLILAFIDGQINFIIRAKASRQSLSCLGHLDTLKPLIVLAEVVKVDVVVSTLLLSHSDIY